MRQRIHSIVAALAALPFLVFAAVVAAEPPTQVRVVWKHDSATEATVSWTTTEEGREHVLKYRADGDEEWTELACQRSGQFAGRLEGKPVPYFHHARLSGLTPATKYEVVCVSDGDATETYHFITAPDEDVPIALLFGGDSRSGIDARQQMNRMMARMVAEQSAAGRPRILALAHGGDFIVDGRRLDQWLQWLTDHELTTTADRRLLPVIPTRGNHDLGPLFDEVFDFPAGDDNYYATDLSPQVRLATLNTEISTAGDQRKWLADELAAHRWHYRWYVAQYHTPAYPAVKVPSGALANWVPLFEEYQIDLACEADGHNIKRTLAIKENKFDPEGVVYIGEGGLGVGQRTPKTGRWYLQETADKCGVGHHVHVLTFHRDRLDCRVVLLGGEVFDEFTLEPRKATKTAQAPEPRRELVAQ